MKSATLNMMYDMHLLVRTPDRTYSAANARTKLRAIAADHLS